MTVFVHCRYTKGYCVIQNDLKQLYSSLQDFVVKQEFKTHILEDAFGMDDIEKKLKQQKADVMKTECPILIAGKKNKIIIIESKKTTRIYFVEQKKQKTKKQQKQNFNFLFLRIIFQCLIYHFKLYCLFHNSKLRYKRGEN